MPERFRLLLGFASLAIIVGSGVVMTLFTLKQSSSQVSSADFSELTKTVNQLVDRQNELTTLVTAQNTPVLATAAAASGNLVSINTADARDLDTLPGIGKVRAEAIIAARATGPFRDLDDLHARVPKIPLSVLQDLVPLINFE